ncbi:hypothetical protein B0J14DRAFT_599579 [Halenospora varia]|nr:hypothetical protein B0J14DRAFT_599579 [Halenospora varia]
MRPALQRLLARPSSLELLRCLVGTPAQIQHLGASRGPTTHRTRYLEGQRTCRRKLSSQAGAARKPEEFVEDEEYDNTGQSVELSISQSTQVSVPVRNSGLISKDPYAPWSERLTKHENLEFESDLYKKSTTARLLDSYEYQDDMKLWAFLLDYRRRIYGMEGVTMFWDIIQRRNISLPTTGFLADKMWSTFLTLGFQNKRVLEQIADYADRMFESFGQRWSKLYTRVVQHFLVNGNGKVAIDWHIRLYPCHAPGPKAFAEMCRQVILWKGDWKSLQKIHKQNKHRNAYSKVIPVLCEREDFKAALHWHFYFLQNGDLPSSSKVVEPLVHFLGVYDRPNAILVTRSLVDAGVSFAHGLDKQLQDNTKISREMMNLIHAQHYNIEPKRYNDKLGARWFATTWVSLDTAINAVHALGVVEIGPLSLQAIALRESDAKDIVLRINQLRDLGISTGNSLFSRAVEKFARAREYDHLESLLNSDQHPDALEDSAFQDSQLLNYAEAKDWAKYRRTLAIQVLRARGTAPAMEKANIMLRVLAKQGNVEGILETLEDMIRDNIKVKTLTINSIMRSILASRRRGHRPVVDTTKRGRYDIRFAISLLKHIAESGSYVPITKWREILRRLGMAGQYKDFQNLCQWILSWYGPQNEELLSVKQKSRRFRVPVQVPSSHVLHPLRILFNASMQKAIVEWGFIMTLKYRTPPKTPNLEDIGQVGDVYSSDSPLLKPDITFGIFLLRKLHASGVHIDFDAIRKVIYSRLVTYYGPSAYVSSKRYNRAAREILGTNPENQGSPPTTSLHDMVQGINNAFGGNRPFISPNYVNVLVSCARRSIRRVEKKRHKLLLQTRQTGATSTSNAMHELHRLRRLQSIYS